MVEDVAHLVLGDDVGAVLVHELIHGFGGANTDAAHGTLEAASECQVACGGGGGGRRRKYRDNYLFTNYSLKSLHTSKSVNIIV